jgi:hypothetical protein
VDTDEQWVVVVAPARPPVAEMEFEQWRRLNAAWASQLRDDDVMIDTIRGVTGETLRRYRVRALRH